MGHIHKEIDRTNADYILYEVLTETENNNNISILTTWAMTVDCAACYYIDPRIAWQYTFRFTVKSLFIDGGDWTTKKHFYYTDERVLNLFLTTDLSRLDNMNKRMYETIKSKIILSLL